MARSSRGEDIGSAFRKMGIVHKPGMAEALMKEYAPLLAEEGIDFDDPSTFDVETLNEALQRAVERRNFELFVATGTHRSHALMLLQSATKALARGDRDTAESIIWTIEPEPRVTGTASVAHVIGVSTGLLDTWNSDRELGGMLSNTVIPGWDKRGRAAAADILALARKGRAFDAIGSLHLHHSGLAILEGGVLVVAGTVMAMAKAEGRPVKKVAEELLDSNG
jgi:hypothetical protein